MAVVTYLASVYPMSLLATVLASGTLCAVSHSVGIIMAICTGALRASLSGETHNATVGAYSSVFVDNYGFCRLVHHTTVRRAVGKA